MYKKYEFDKTITDIYVIGDLHGSFQLLKYKIRESGVTNALIIVAGDCGFGFEKPKYYEEQYNKMLNILTNQNVTLVFIRGNHDDKSFFDGEKINFPNFIAVPDYSVLQVNTENGLKNILCVGGAISIDRRWRLKEETKYTNGKKLYWVDEFPVYIPETLTKIKDDGIIIDYVITHTSPDFAPLTDKNGISNFIAFDFKLIDDVNNERLTLTSIYNHLIKIDKHPIKTWYYGHFHQHQLYYSEDDVKFIMLDCVGDNNNSWDIHHINLF